MGSITILVVGIALVVSGLLLLLTHTIKLKHICTDGYETIAKIIGFSGIGKHRRVMVAYETEKGMQTVNLGHYSNRMRIGDHVKIYVNKENLREIAYAGKAPILWGIAVIIIGALLLACWLVGFFGTT